MSLASARGRAPASLLGLAAVVCLPFAGGYFLSYLYRSVNAVIAPDLVRDIGLSATDLGVLTAAYFLGFALFQLPLGLLLDRFGPRRVQAILLLSAAVGAVLYATGDTMFDLAVGRALIGVGVAGGLMASFKAIVLWFPKERWPLVNGCFLAAGGLGALAATAPVEALLHVTDWRGIFLGLAAVNLLVCVAIWLIVPEREEDRARGGLGEALAGVAEVLRDRLFWRLAPAAMASMGGGMAVQTLWAGPWLRDVVGLDRADAAQQLFVLAAMLTAGFIGTGVIADRLGRAGVRLETMIGWALALCFLCQLPLVFGWGGGVLVAWLGIGVLANSSVLMFPLLSGHFTARLSGRANTTLNMLAFGATFGVQAAVGWVIDLWPPLGEGRYDPEAYRWAFGALVVLQVAAWLWYLVPGRHAAGGAAR